jgi:hypothetical protein
MNGFKLTVKPMGESDEEEAGGCNRGIAVGSRNSFGG